MAGAQGAFRAGEAEASPDPRDPQFLNDVGSGEDGELRGQPLPLSPVLSGRSPDPLAA